MTIEKAIEIIRRYECNSEHYEACEMAIKALKQEPSEDMTIAYLMGYYADKEPCDDVVSRKAVEEIINDIRDCISVEGYWAIIERLKKLPSVRPQEQKTGNMYEDKGVLEQLAEKQNNLSATNKAWRDVIEKNGYVN